MRKQLIGEARCRELPVRYYLLEDETDEGRPLYGIQVEYGGERMSILELTCSRQRAEALLGLLIRGCVTPVTVRDVVEDWLLM